MSTPTSIRIRQYKLKRPTPIERARDFYLELIRGTNTVAAECDNCEEVFPLDKILPLEGCDDLGERLDRASVVPDGECPKCGTFAYRI
jgi:hypothetical protein